MARGRTVSRFPVFAGQFLLEKPIVSARLYISGVGAYAATLNGKPVTDDVLAPGNTKFEYSRRVCNL